MQMQVKNYFGYIKHQKGKKHDLIDFCMYFSMFLLPHGPVWAF